MHWFSDNKCIVKVKEIVSTTTHFKIGKIRNLKMQCMSSYMKGSVVDE